jgi:hypothetical protein
MFSAVPAFSIVSGVYVYENNGPLQKLRMTATLVVRAILGMDEHQQRKLFDDIYDLTSKLDIIPPIQEKQ